MHKRRKRDRPGGDPLETQQKQPSPRLLCRHSQSLSQHAASYFMLLQKCLFLTSSTNSPFSSEETFLQTIRDAAQGERVGMGTSSPPCSNHVIQPFTTYLVSLSCSPARSLDITCFLDFPIKLHKYSSKELPKKHNKGVCIQELSLNGINLLAGSRSFRRTLLKLFVKKDNLFLLEVAFSQAWEHDRLFLYSYRGKGLGTASCSALCCWKNAAESENLSPC